MKQTFTLDVKVFQKPRMGEKTTDGGGTPEMELCFSLVSPERAKDGSAAPTGLYIITGSFHVGGFTPACVLNVPSGLSFAQVEVGLCAEMETLL